MTTHTYHEQGLAAGLDASCPRCLELAERIDAGEYTPSPGFDDRDHVAEQCDACPACKGTGAYTTSCGEVHVEDCPVCEGSGVTAESAAQLAQQDSLDVALKLAGGDRELAERLTYNAQVFVDRKRLTDAFDGLRGVYDLMVLQGGRTAFGCVEGIAMAVELKAAQDMNAELAAGLEKRQPGRPRKTEDAHA